MNEINSELTPLEQDNINNIYEKVEELFINARRHPYQPQGVPFSRLKYRNRQTGHELDLSIDERRSVEIITPASLSEKQLGLVEHYEKQYPQVKASRVLRLLISKNSPDVKSYSRVYDDFHITSEDPKYRSNPNIMGDMNNFKPTEEYTELFKGLLNQIDTGVLAPVENYY
jgi:hypothetical protein